MSAAIHQQFLSIARKISAPLHEALEQIGPIDFITRREAPLPELLCRSVAGQQLSTKAARTIWQRVLDSADGSPLLDYIYTCDAKNLRACGLSAAKAKAMSAIAHTFLTGEINEDKLEQLNQKQRTKALVSIWGVGPWTADMVNMFYYCETDIWPDKDIAATKTFQNLIGEDKDINDMAKKFAPHRSFLAMYMWQEKDNRPLRK